MLVFCQSEFLRWKFLLSAANYQRGLIYTETHWAIRLRLLTFECIFSKKGCGISEESLKSFNSKTDLQE